MVTLRLLAAGLNRADARDDQATQLLRTLGQPHSMKWKIEARFIDDVVESVPRTSNDRMLVSPIDYLDLVGISPCCRNAPAGCHEPHRWGLEECEDRMRNIRWDCFFIDCTPDPSCFVVSH
jgi:hypothetical protein